MEQVLVIGGGYAGVTAARAAAREGAAVTLVDETGRHDLLPRLAMVAGGTAPVGDAWADLAELLAGEADVVVGRVERVDAEDRVALLADGRALPYDAAVVTVGAVPLPPAIPGLVDHALLLKEARHALVLREWLAAASALVVVGGGATGVQLAAEASRAHLDLRVTVVEADDRLLPSMAPGMGRRAEAVLRRRGAAVLVGVGLARVTARGAVLADGTELDGLVVWAGGTRFGASAVLPGAAAEGGRLVVDPAQQVPGLPGVLAAGDAALQRGRQGRLQPLSGQVAEQSGTVAGRNAARLARGRAPQPGRVRHRGWVVPLGGLQGVAVVLGLVLALPGTGWIAGLLHAAIDAKHLVKAGGLGALRRWRPGAATPVPDAVEEVRCGLPAGGGVGVSDEEVAVAC